MDLKILKETPPWEWPENADRMFHKFLTDKQTENSDRVLAAELAGDFTVINEELVNALLTILQNNDESDELRSKAAISLGPVLEHADNEGFEVPDDVPISENTFHRIQKLLHRVYLDANVTDNVRRRILEASIRAPQDWHKDAIRAAYFSDDEDWKLTAVFSMRWVRGFDNQILEALESSNHELHYQAVCAAGNWEIDSAWSHVSNLIKSKDTEKSLLLTSIDAVVSIRPQEAGVILVNLTESTDEDIGETAHEAMIMARGLSGEEFDDEDEDWNFH